MVRCSFFVTGSPTGGIQKHQITHSLGRVDIVISEVDYCFFIPKAGLTRPSMLGQGRLEEGAAPRRGIPPVPRAPVVERVEGVVALVVLPTPDPLGPLFRYAVLHSTSVPTPDRVRGGERRVVASMANSLDHAASFARSLVCTCVAHSSPAHSSSTSSVLVMYVSWGNCFVRYPLPFD